jgi:hypothetical protein
MTRSRFLVGLATVAMLVGSLFATSAAASAPLHGTGTSTLVSSTVLSVRQDGPNTVIEQLNTRSDAGAFTGAVYEHQWVTVHPTGLITTHADATLVGVYPDCGPTTVTQSIHLEGQISPAGDISANFATTGNAAVIVHGTVAGTTASNTVTFTIDYHC